VVLGKGAAQRPVLVVVDRRKGTRKETGQPEVIRVPAVGEKRAGKKKKIGQCLGKVTDYLA